MENRHTADSCVTAVSPPDSLAELRTLQSRALEALQCSCAMTDFTDRGSIHPFREQLQAVRDLLRDCFALESRHLYPLIDRVAPQSFELPRDRQLVQAQMNTLWDRLECIYGHAQRCNPAWRAVLDAEGRAFSRALTVSVYVYLVHLECQHAATTAVSLRCGCGALPALERQLHGALLALKETHRPLIDTFVCDGDVMPKYFPVPDFAAV